MEQGIHDPRQSKKLRTVHLEAVNAYESTNQCLAITDRTHPAEWLANMFHITAVQSMLLHSGAACVRRMN
jgi:hypothetical protein